MPHTPKDSDKLIWCAAWALRVFKVPQVILTCSKEVHSSSRVACLQLIFPHLGHRISISILTFPPYLYRFSDPHPQEISVCPSSWLPVTTVLMISNSTEAFFNYFNCLFSPLFLEFHGIIISNLHYAYRCTNEYKNNPYLQLTYYLMEDFTSL